MGRAVQACSTGVTICDAMQPGLPLVYVNTAFEQMTGYAAAEVLGKEVGLLQGPNSDLEAVLGMRAAVAAGREHVVVVRNYCKDGRAWWNELRLSPVRDDAGDVTHYFGFQNDVTARVEAEQRVAHLAYHDVLTGLPNRLQLLEGLDAALVRARVQNSHLAVLFVDLDGFKSVNDQLGHAAGDLVLIAAGERLRATLRDDDLLGRYSGDEFLVVLTGVSPEQVRSIADRVAGAVVDSFRSPLSVSGEPVEVGASVGMALFPQHGSDADTLLRAADAAMYTAKLSGRGRAAVAVVA
jgi:diguanylate cyclase (GGDEF)-like protein/PAS domain S-box-containing protein